MKMAHTGQHNMRFVFMGNCQMVALCQYIRNLSRDYETLWVCPDRFKDSFWVTSKPRFENIFGIEQSKHNITEHSKIIESLQTTDVVVYQPHFDSNNIVEDNCRNNQIKITIAPIFVNSTERMKIKEKKYNTNIKVSEIIEKNKDKTLYVKDKDNHHSSFLLLEIVREICALLNIEFYQDEKYKELLNKQYPYY